MDVGSSEGSETGDDARLVVLVVDVENLSSSLGL
jgi:hypothetical protein